MIKQDIHIYISSGRPNGWTEWADIFCGHSWVARLKIKYLKKKKFHWQRWALQLVFIKKKYEYIQTSMYSVYIQRRKTVPTGIKEIG